MESVIVYADIALVCKHLRNSAADSFKGIWFWSYSNGTAKENSTNLFGFELRFIKFPNKEEKKQKVSAYDFTTKQNQVGEIVNSIRHRIFLITSNRKCKKLSRWVKNKVLKKIALTPMIKLKKFYQLNHWRSCLSRFTGTA